ncbi:MAG: leucine-rich repeat domain-containing protein [Prevotella sp.]|nr:leucine-rich repeat domain-containing protein [Prevotella sp.]
MKTKRLFLTALAAVCCMILSLSVTSCASDIADNPVDGPVVVPIVGQGETFACNFDSGSGSYTLNFSITSEPTEENSELPFEVCLTYCDWSENCNVDIPATVEHNGQEYTVTAIGDRAFDRESEHLSSVAIPASVKSIGKYAFRSCENLISVSFADNSQLENIGVGAFQDCSSLAAITIPASVTTIGMHAFDHCSSLSTVSFADNAQLEVIDSNLFKSCTSLETITLPASVKKIGWWVFEGCTNLKTVYLNSDPVIYSDFPDGVEVVYLNHDN